MLTIKCNNVFLSQQMCFACQTNKGLNRKSAGGGFEE